jgi:hypothetical protein
LLGAKGSRERRDSAFASGSPYSDKELCPRGALKLIRGTRCSFDITMHRASWAKSQMKRESKMAEQRGK